jgi:acetoin utilization protein AcuB
MKVRELMAFGPEPVTVRSDDTLDTAGRLMLARAIRHLPVYENGKLLGVLSERDLLAFRGYGGLMAPVRNAMQSPAQTATPDDEVEAVALRLATDRIGCLPIMEGGKLVGIVTTTDLLAQRARGSEVRRTGISGRVADAMTRDPQTARLDDMLLDALGRMTNANIRHLPIVDGENRVLGMLSDRDVRRALGDLSVTEGEEGLRLRIREARVGQAASLGALSVSQDAALTDAVNLFIDHRIGALPVVDEGGRLVGILSYIDVLKHLAGTDVTRSGAAVIPPGPQVPASR